VLGGIGGTLFGGFRSHSLFKDTKKKYDNLLASGSTDAGMLSSLHSDYRRYQRNRNLFFVGTGLVYLWSLADGVYNYRFNTGEHSPSKATIYSTIFPGLGQIYNKKYWKLPLVYGGFAAFSYFIQSNSFRYNLYGDAYNVKSRLDKLPETGFEEERAALESQIPNVLKNLQADRLKYYRDAYRRDRDFFIILTVLFYGIQIIDAAVDAHFYTYDISNDLSFKFTPFVDQAAYGSVCGGVNLSFRF
jgi:hypothetical protein